MLSDGIMPRRAVRAWRRKLANKSMINQHALKVSRRALWYPGRKANVQQRRPAMLLQINDIVPDSEAETTAGRIRFHDWIGDKWAVLFAHPKDFTPVCTTELGYMAKIKPEFDKRGVKIIELSVDPVDKHSGWAADIKETQ